MLSKDEFKLALDAFGFNFKSQEEYELLFG